MNASQLLEIEILRYYSIENNLVAVEYLLDNAVVTEVLKPHQLGLLAKRLGKYLPELLEELRVNN